MKLSHEPTKNRDRLPSSLRLLVNHARVNFRALIIRNFKQFDALGVNKKAAFVHRQKIVYRDHRVDCQLREFNITSCI